MIYFLLSPLIVIALFVVALFVLAKWFANTDKAIEEIKSLTDISEETKQEAIACINRAHEADSKLRIYDLSAPLVMLLVLPFVKNEAESLPKAFRKWDNNVSLNGDGLGWQDTDGVWWDSRVKPVPEGVEAIKHNDLRYKGDCYYAKGHHPRSFWARYVWVGWRNRASMISLKAGVAVDSRPELISGNLHINRSGPFGHFLLKHNNNYHYKSMKSNGKYTVIRSVGYKLEIVAKSASGVGNAAAVSIGRSLKRTENK